MSNRVIECVCVCIRLLTKDIGRLLSLCVKVKPSCVESEDNAVPEALTKIIVCDFFGPSSVRSYVT